MSQNNNSSVDNEFSEKANKIDKVIKIHKNSTQK